MHSSKTVLPALIVLLFAYSVAYGCDCATLNSEESFRQAESVFQGRVIRIEPIGSDQKVTFEVRRFLKGGSTDYVSLYQEGSNCDFQFVEGWSYLVYADEVGGKLSASTCSRTMVFNYHRCGSGRWESRDAVYLGMLRERGFGYGEIALITAICVSLSMSAGFITTRLWRRHNEQEKQDTGNDHSSKNEP